MESVRTTRRAASVRFTICALASAAAAAVALTSGSARAATRTENFDVEPTNWIGVNNVGGNNYGFRNTDLTGQGSGAGEAGGTFGRNNERGMYADNTIGTLTQTDFIHGEGEFWFGNGANADNDGFLGHQHSQWLFPGFNINTVGIGIFEQPTTSFRFAPLIYTDQGGERVGTRLVMAEGQYKFVYDWNPQTLQLTATFLAPDGSDPNGGSPNSSTVTLGASDAFSVDSFGLGAGFSPFHTVLDGHLEMPVYLRVHVVRAAPELHGSTTCRGERMPAMASTNRSHRERPEANSSRPLFVRR